MIQVHRGSQTTLISEGNEVYSHPSFSFDALFKASDPQAYLREAMREGTPVAGEELVSDTWLAPIESQEVWASGVTYYRSREARMEESEQAGGDVFYDLVYEAERPELFFKATPHRVSGQGQPLRIREDASWNVPNRRSRWF